MRANRQEWRARLAAFCVDVNAFPAKESRIDRPGARPKQRQRGADGRDEPIADAGWMRIAHQERSNCRERRHDRRPHPGYEEQAQAQKGDLQEKCGKFRHAPRCGGRIDNENGRARDTQQEQPGSGGAGCKG
jgi:hypothetical protein